MSESSNANSLGQTSSNTSGNAALTLPLWLRGIVVLGAILILVGAGVALFRPVILVTPPDEINGADKIYAAYLASRNLALAIMLLAAMGRRIRQVLTGLLLLAALIQMLDAVIDCLDHRWAVAPGVICSRASISRYWFWTLPSASGGSIQLPERCST